MSSHAFLAAGAGGRSAGFRRTAMLVAMYLLLGVYWPYELVFDTPYLRRNFGFEYWTALAIQQYCAIRFALLAAHNRPHFLALTFFMFVYVWAGLAGALQINLEVWPWRVRHEASDTQLAIIMLAVAVLFYDIGRLWHRVRTPALQPAPMREIRFRVSLKQVLIVSAVALPAALYGIVLFGFDSLFATRAIFANAAAQDVGKTGLLLGRALLRSPSLAALFLAMFYAFQNWSNMSRSHKRVTLGLTLALLLLNAVTNYPQVQARYWLAAMFFTPLFAFVPWRRGFMAGWILGLTFVLLWLYPRADLFRYAQTLAEAIENVAAKKQKRDFFFTGDYDAVQATANAVVFVDIDGPMYGKNLLGAAFFYVPRAVWPGKPPGTGPLVAAKLNYGYTNLSTPLWAEFYIAFGWFGTTLLMALYGYASAAGDRAVTRNKVHGRNRADMWVLLVSFWAAFQFFLVRGDLINAIGYSSLCAGLIFVGSRPQWHTVDKHASIVDL